MAKERWIYTVRLTFVAGPTISVCGDNIKDVVARAQHELRQRRQLALVNFDVDCQKQSPREL